MPRKRAFALPLTKAAATTDDRHAVAVYRGNVERAASRAGWQGAILNALAPRLPVLTGPAIQFSERRGLTTERAFEEQGFGGRRRWKPKKGPNEGPLAWTVIATMASRISNWYEPNLSAYPSVKIL